MTIFVDAVPDCEECPFWIEDTNKDYLEADKFRCMLRAKVSTAQYGGMDITEMEVRDCPLKQLPCLRPEYEHRKCPTCGCGRCGGKSNIDVSSGRSPRYGHSHDH